MNYFQMEGNACNIVCADISTAVVRLTIWSLISVRPLRYVPHLICGEGSECRRSH